MTNVDKKHGAPRHLPLHKFYEVHPDFSQAVEDEYERRFGNGSESETDGDESDKEGEKVNGGAEGSGGGEVNDENAGSSASVAEKDQQEDRQTARKQPGRHGLKMVRHVEIAKELYNTEPEDVKNRLKLEVEESYQQRTAEFKESLGASRLQDHSLVPALVFSLFINTVAEGICF